MALEAGERQIEGIVLFDLRGRLVAGDDAEDFETRLAATLAAGSKSAILNLKHASFIDSTGLGAMVGAHSAFKRAGGALKLLHVSERHAELLVLTKLSTVFEIFDDEQAAIDSFFPDRAVRRFDILDFVKSEEKEQEG
ncbi:MAG TPA: STAS domain-containing protein [Bryobacteraceae bacterium]